ncbi:type IV pilus biogenesis protein PilM [Candidatus Zixiibacteriota bacterium]
MSGFLGMLPGRSAGAVGLSIEENTVKYAELQQASGGRFRIGMWGSRNLTETEEPLEQDAASEVPLMPIKAGAGGPLQQAWTIGLLHKLKRQAVFASFADRDILLKFLSLPELNEQEVARMVELRHREYLPMPRADIVYDFSITRFEQPQSHTSGDDAEEQVVDTNNEGELRVMVSGIERGAYLVYRDSIAEQGLVLRSLETNQTAFTRGCNFFLGRDHPGTYAALYLNDTYSMVNFVVSRGLYYSRLLEPGLQNLTQDDAGSRRLDRLLRELYRSVDFFSVESRGVPIETLYLVNGGLAADPGISHRIQKYLSERLSVNVQSLHEVAEENDRIALPAGTIAGTLILPIGLALRSHGEMAV